MHRSIPSRGRVLFEVLCALGMSASLAGAGMQTHATALLGAAGVAAFYALVHLFDLRRPKSAETAEPQRIEFDPPTADIVVPMVAVDEPVAVACPVGVEAAVESDAPRAGSGRRTGGSRKGGGRRAKAPKAAKVVELTPVEEVGLASVEVAEAAWPMADEPEAEMLADPVNEEEFVFPDSDEPSQQQIAPLFEPEPFARMQRRAFGRRGRL